ncbi:MAG: hypothetical protein ABIQ64_01025 [Candidatus Saccharimonadales bacterium]
MISVDDSNKIIELRSTGLSFDNIAAITKVSKPTVMKLCHDRQQDVANKHNRRNDDTLDSIEQRKLIYQAIIEKASAELLSRELEGMSSRELINTISSTEKALSYIMPPPMNKTPSNLSTLSDNELRHIAQALEYAN